MTTAPEHREHIVEVALAARSYSIILPPGGLADAAGLIAPRLARPWTAIISDAHVAPLYLEPLAAALRAAGVTVHQLVIPPGEGSKSWAGLAELCDWLAKVGVERGDHVVALGGGVIGDLVGFATAIIKRGCRFVQIPTSLLAQVDSSVGGKTAINIAAGKNLVGAFHQPSMVVIDPATLATLPRREVAAGYAEVVKYGLLGDAAFFGWCEAHGAALLAGDAAARRHAILHSCRAKAAIVAADERETVDIRALLNLGHTFGHALEADTGYSSRLLHGEAVAAGMALAFGFAAHVGLCPADDAARVRAHLAGLGLPHSLASAGVSASGAVLAGHMAHDKKAQGGRVPLILPRAIGDCIVTADYGLDRVAAYLDAVRD